MAGAPGSGKSTFMPGTLFGVDHFNADDEAAKLNGERYQAIPQAIRHEVNLRFERFIRNHISEMRSLAIETTLRSTTALAQAQQAHETGFFVQMHYIATDQLATNLNRVVIRSRGGGHAAPVAVLADIREKSFRNLSAAIRAVPHIVDELVIYDNSVDGQFMRMVARLGNPSEDRTLNLQTFDPPTYPSEYINQARART